MDIIEKMKAEAREHRGGVSQREVEAGVFISVSHYIGPFDDEFKWNYYKRPYRLTEDEAREYLKSQSS